jgi:Radical SAM superfamily
MKRTYAADGHLVHDPATGLTHRAPNPVATDRVRWEQTEVSGWPVVALSELDRAMPVSVCWSPIVRCNLHCSHCLDDTSVPELIAADRGRIAGVLAAAGVLGVDISGGEPLLLRELPTLAQGIAADGYTVVSVTTNGWHLARRAEELTESVDAIRVSLDAPDAASHDRLRGPGSFTRAQDGIRAAVSPDIHPDHQRTAQTLLAALPEVVIATGHPRRVYTCDGYHNLRQDASPDPARIPTHRRALRTDGRNPGTAARRPHRSALRRSLRTRTGPRPAPRHPPPVSGTTMPSCGAQLLRVGAHQPAHAALWAQTVVATDGPALTPGSGRRAPWQLAH